MINLLSLMLMDTRDPSFRAIPPWASAMIFELYSMGADGAFPQDEEDLYVRFYFHNGTTDFNDQLLAFPMFNRGLDTTGMRWADFNTMFSRIMMETILEWCTSCNAPSLFCTGVDTDTIIVANPRVQRANNYAVSPPVAGVIGAVVTLVVAGLLFALAMLLGGVRFHRTSRRPKSELGGFKGSAKLASDPDLANLPKGGALPAGVVGFGATNVNEGRTRHERVGSWELRQKEWKSGDMGEEFPSPRESFEGIDGVVGKPVEPRESV